MSMTDRDALLAAIIENPEEDTPRLMFADWLQENGATARGEFIRLQVEAAHAEPFSPQARTHEAAAQKLLQRHVGVWADHISERVCGQRFARGFVEHVSVNAATFARDAAPLFAAEPIRSLQVERFTYTTPPPPLDALFNLPQMTRVTRLDFSKLGLQPDEFGSFTFAWPRFSAITDLSLRNTAVSVPWLGKLLTGPELPALAGLDFAHDAHLGRVLATELPKASHRRLTTLDLSAVVFASDQIQKALASRCLRAMEELRFTWHKSAGPGPLTYLNVGWTLPWDYLRVLDIEGQGVGDEGVRESVAALCRRKDFAPLRWLGLANTGLRADAVHALVNSDKKRLRLYHLDVRNNGLSATHKAALEDRFPEAEVLV